MYHWQICSPIQCVVFSFCWWWLIDTEERLRAVRGAGGWVKRWRDEAKKQTQTTVWWLPERKGGRVGESRGRVNGGWPKETWLWCWVHNAEGRALLPLPEVVLAELTGEFGFVFLQCSHVVQHLLACLAPGQKSPQETQYKKSALCSSLACQAGWSWKSQPYTAVRLLCVAVLSRVRLHPLLGALNSPGWAESPSPMQPLCASKLSSRNGSIGGGRDADGDLR